MQGLTVAQLPHLSTGRRARDQSPTTVVSLEYFDSAWGAIHTNSNQAAGSSSKKTAQVVMTPTPKGDAVASGAELSPRTLRQACYPARPGSAMCVQNLDDSRGFAVRTTYRISLRSSSLGEPRHPLLKVVHFLSTAWANSRAGVICRYLGSPLN